MKRENIKKECVVCGNEFECKTEKRETCSAKCYRKIQPPINKTYHKLVCNQCGTEFENVDKKRMFCSVICAVEYKASHLKYIVKKCQMCGCEYKTTASHINSRFCSHSCSGKSYDRQRYKTRKEYFSKYQKENSNKYKGRYKPVKAYEREGRKCTIHIYKCKECGDLFVAKSKLAVFCSERCQYINRNNNVFDERKCVICSKTFNKKYGKTEHRNVCSDGCYDELQREYRRNVKKKRKLKIKEQFIESVISKRVYIRDGFRCKICGKKMDMTRAVPHPMSPTIDHIVPVSLGGEHSYKNVRSAHFICNSLRSNKATANDQLLLFGL